ncbi:MAG TPA: phosphoethanolamine transferase [Burkholderiales bacterium]|nr:phosphoethanolamine transferase [Burkholderiales bacterium]
MRSILFTRLAAAAITLPFVLALPAEGGDNWQSTSYAALLVATFFLARFVAEQLAGPPNGKRLITGFALLFLLFALLAFASTDSYRFGHAAADLATLYLVFFLAVIVGQIAPRLARTLLVVLILAQALGAIVQMVHWQSFGFAIEANGYRAILQSDPGEAEDFIGRFVSGYVLAAALLSMAIAGAAGTVVRPAKLSRQSLGWAAAFAFAALGVVSGHLQFAASRAAVFSTALDYAAEISEYRAVREARRMRVGRLDMGQQGPLAGEPLTLVFVVGESLSRNHMSIYGYWRDTNPALEKLSRETVVFTDVVSPHSHTDPSLKLVLTLADHANRMAFGDAENYSLIELLKAAGFTTWWLSNQNVFGPWDNEVAALAQDADHVHYTSRSFGPMVKGKPDEVLLAPLAAALHDPAPRKAIFLHLLGNHWEYAKRYPASASAFQALPSSAEIGALQVRPSLSLINQYDNAVRYNDQLVARVIEALRETRQPAALTMFSDHGEDVWGAKYHYWKQFTHDHVEVPLVLWFSPEYLRLAHGVVERAREHGALPFALEDLPHLVADLAGLRSKALDPELSPISSRYRAPQARWLFDGQFAYEEADEPMLNARRLLRQLAAEHPALARSIWAHRVDTLGKMMEAAQLFPGVEMDVLYDAGDNRLMINHPPQPVSGLTLEAMLAYAQRLNPKLRLWLDVKNFDEANGPHIVAALDHLDRRYALRERALVETDYTGPATALLHRAGYHSSYYLPTGVVTGTAHDAPETSCAGADRITRALLARPFAAVSYDWRGNAWVERCLGAFVREHGLKRYTWDLRTVSSRADAFQAVAAQWRDYSRMAAILLPYKSQFDDLR